MEKYAFIIEGSQCTLQGSDYIEHGWFINFDLVSPETYNLYEIPYGGGTAQHIGGFFNLNAALTAAKKLT